MDPIVVSLYDSVLRQSDCALIAAPHWFNDALIAFYYEYLSRQVYADREDVLFLHPATACLVHSMLGCMSDVIEQVLAPLDLKCFECIFVPVNDGSGDAAGSGSHWSLLVFDRSLGLWEYYDSCGKMNYRIAQGLVACLNPLVADKTKPTLKHVSCPQQRNGYDCGCHLLLLTSLIAQDRVSKVPVDIGHADGTSAAKIRQELLHLATKHKKDSLSA